VLSVSAAKQQLNPSLRVVRPLVEQFYVALKQVPADAHPHGGILVLDACALVGQYLRDMGASDVYEVSGWDQNSGWGHTWIEIGDLIVDLGPPAFLRSKSPFIVTRSKRLHGRFSRDRRSSPSAIDIWDKFTWSRLHLLYAAVVRRIPKAFSPHRPVELVPRERPWPQRDASNATHGVDPVPAIALVNVGQIPSIAIPQPGGLEQKLRALKLADNDLQCLLQYAMECATAYSRPAPKSPAQSTRSRDRNLPWLANKVSRRTLRNHRKQVEALAVDVRAYLQRAHDGTFVLQVKLGPEITDSISKLPDTLLRYSDGLKLIEQYWSDRMDARRSDDEQKFMLARVVGFIKHRSRRPHYGLVAELLSGFSDRSNGFDPHTIEKTYKKIPDRLKLQAA
jgi:hypothetical protein